MESIGLRSSSIACGVQQYVKLRFQVSSNRAPESLRERRCSLWKLEKTVAVRASARSEKRNVPESFLPTGFQHLLLPLCVARMRRQKNSCRVRDWKKTRNRLLNLSFYVGAVFLLALRVDARPSNEWVPSLVHMRGRCGFPATERDFYLNERSCRRGSNPRKIVSTCVPPQRAPALGYFVHF